MFPGRVLLRRRRTNGGETQPSRAPVGLSAGIRDVSFRPDVCCRFILAKNEPFAVWSSLSSVVWLALVVIQASLPPETFLLRARVKSGPADRSQLRPVAPSNDVSVLKELECLSVCPVRQRWHESEAVFYQLCTSQRKTRGVCVTKEK